MTTTPDMRAPSGAAPARDGQPEAGRPWQIRLFEKTLKKKQKVALLARLLGRPDPAERILFVTNGDNNGAMNHCFRELPGRWTWAELEAASIPEMQAFLGELVVHVTPEHLPFEDGVFDAAIVIDVHEHLEDPTPLDRELFRVVRPGGRAIVTVPDGDGGRPAVRVKRLLGMTKEVYGHVRDGYTIGELAELVSGSGFRPRSSGSYSGFFTEMVELALNVAYVKVLNRKRGGGETGANGHAPIAPSSAEQMRKAEKTLRLYGLIYPFCRAMAGLDRLLAPFATGYAVAVEFERPAGDAWPGARRRPAAARGAERAASGAS